MNWLNIFNYFGVLNQLKTEKEAQKVMQKSVVINHIFLSSYTTSGGFEWPTTPSFFLPANLQSLSWEDCTMTKAKIANGWTHLCNQQGNFPILVPLFLFFSPPAKSTPCWPLKCFFSYIVSTRCFFKMH